MYQIINFSNSIKLVDLNNNDLIMWLKKEIKGEELEVSIVKRVEMSEEQQDSLVDYLICG